MGRSQNPQLAIVRARLVVEEHLAMFPRRNFKDPLVGAAFRRARLASGLRPISIVEAFQNTQGETMAKKGKRAEKKRGARDGDNERVREYKMNLPVELTDAEIVKKARKLGRLAAERKKLLEDGTEAASKFRKKAKELKAEIDVLEADLDGGTEARSVPVVETLVFSRNICIIKRKDTGAVVEQRAITAEEKQEAFPDPNDPAEQGRLAREEEADLDTDDEGHEGDSAGA